MAAHLPPPGSDAAMITAAQCRSARTLLGWSVAKLAAAASLAESTINDFELERRRPEDAAIDAIEHALQAVGTAFMPGDDVCLRGRADAVR